MKRRLLSGVLASLSTLAQAQNLPEAGAPFQGELAKWAKQEAAATRDIELVDSVLKRFFIASKPTTGAPVPTTVNRALEPLRARFPDYRLKYRSPLDYCPTLRAINDARLAANRRILYALREKERVLVLSQAYNSVVIILKANALLGKEVEDDVIRSAFNSIVESPDREISTDWDGMDYLENNHLSDSNCD